MKYYVLQVLGDVQPELHGPYHSSAMRDERARHLRSEDPEKENGLFRVQSKSEVLVDSYAGGEFPE